RLTAVGPLLVSSNQSTAYGLFPLPQGATSETNTPVGTGLVAVTFSVNRSDVAAGCGPTAGSSTATPTVNVAPAVRWVPVLRYRPVWSTWKSAASGPVTVRLLVPSPSSETSTSATFTGAEVLVSAGTELTWRTSLTAGGAWSGVADGL